MHTFDAVSCSVTMHTFTKKNSRLYHQFVIEVSALDFVLCVKESKNANLYLVSHDKFILVLKNAYLTVVSECHDVESVKNIAASSGVLLRFSPVFLVPEL
jgi:hypothetical protein